jgi:hypothetical protein
MPVFRFHCPSCQKLIRNFVDYPPQYDKEYKDAQRYKFCPYCGSSLVQRGHNAISPSPQYSHNLRIPVQDFSKLLGPIIDLNGWSWLADKVGVHESRVRRVFEQNYVTHELADKWLTKLGLTNALLDGSLRIVKPYESTSFDHLT